MLRITFYHTNHRFAIKYIEAAKIKESRFDMDNYNEEMIRQGNVSRNMDNYPQALREINPENMGKTMAYKLIYPEIYYKLQPYIMMVCDQMDVYNSMPTQEMVESMTDAIYDDVVRMFPDIAEYVREHENREAPETIQADAISVQVDPFRGRDRDRIRFPRSRRRGLFRDLIDILLLTELLRRRRR